jgi:hypothetical protein
MLLEELALKVNRQAKDFLVGLGEELESSSEKPIDFLRALNEPISKNYPYRFLGEHDSLKKGLLTYKKTRDQGVLDVAQNIGEYDKEETWIFVPEVGLWIADTFNSSCESTGGDPYLRMFLTEIFSKVELIHTHPDKSLKQQYNDGVRGRHYLIEGATPTSSDLVSLTQQQAQSSKGSEVAGGIIGHYGLCIYEMSEVNLRLREGGACAGCDPKTINPKGNPVREIHKLLKNQAKRAQMVQFSDQNIPAFDFGFVAYSEMGD